MTWTDIEVALWELKAMGIGLEQIWRDPDGHARGDVYGATADEMRRIADLLHRLDAGRAPLPKGPAGPSKFESFNSYPDEKRVRDWLRDGADGMKLSTLARAVLLIIAEHANDKTGEAWPGNNLMATQLGCAPRSIDRALTELRGANLIKSKQVGAPGANRHARHHLVGPLSLDAQESEAREEPRRADVTPRRAGERDGTSRNQVEEEAAARGEPESPNPEAGEETRTTANGATYTEADYWEWCRRKADTKSPIGKGLEIKIHREDRPEFEAQLHKAEGQARTTRAQRQRDEDRRNCPFNHTEEAPGVGYRLADGTPTTYDHPDAESFICEHGKPDTATRAQTRESGDLTEVDAIAEELIHR